MAASVENSLTLNMDMNNQVNNAGSGEPQVHEWYNFILFANYLANLKKKNICSKIDNKETIYKTIRWLNTQHTATTFKYLHGECTEK